MAAVQEWAQVPCGISRRCHGIPEVIFLRLSLTADTDGSFCRAASRQGPGFSIATSRRAAIYLTPGQVAQGLVLGGRSARRRGRCCGCPCRDGRFRQAGHFSLLSPVLTCSEVGHCARSGQQLPRPACESGAQDAQSGHGQNSPFCIFEYTWTDVSIHETLRPKQERRLNGPNKAFFQHCDFRAPCDPPSQPGLTAPISSQARLR